MATEIISAPVLGTLTAHEWHSFVLGLHAGLEGEGDAVLDVALGERDPDTVADPIADEVWYASGGAVVGRCLRELDTAAGKFVR